MEFGICVLSIIPVRESPAHSSEQTTQLLFGETFYVLKQQKDWIYIRATYDNYEGWIEHKQAYPLIQYEFERIEQHNHPLSSDLAQLLVINGRILQPIVLGSRLPFLEKNICSIDVNTYLYEGSYTTPQQKPSLEQIKEHCLSYLNAPYLWGGKTPFGVDCSGFAQMVYKLCGTCLPRDAWQQAELGQPIHLINEAQIGDLLFFQNEPQKKISHVGIYLGHNKIIHASGYVRIDSIDHEGIYNMDTCNYTHKLRIIKRYI